MDEREASSDTSLELQMFYPVLTCLLSYSQYVQSTFILQDNKHNGRERRTFDNF